MKIAVYLGEISPVECGGFTFQDDIFRGLLSSELAKQHKFVIYCNLQKEQMISCDHANFEWESRPSKAEERIRRWLASSFDSIEFILESMHIAGRFDRSLRRRGVELVWFLTPHFQRTSLPYIYTIWDLQHRVQPWFPEVASSGRWYFREKMYSRAIARASAIVVPNATGRDQVTHLYRILPDRVLMLPEPTPSYTIDAPRSMGGQVMEKFGLPNRYLFYPAQLHPHKNHVNLFAAVKLLKERSNISLPVVLTGADRGNEAYLKSLTREWNLNGQIFFLGYVSRDDLVGLYRNALALTFMSFIGPSNFPPLEAFALGCPVIASRIPGAQEQMGDAALLVDPTDVEGLAAAIESVYSNETLRQDLISRGVDRASRWTAQEYVAKILAYADQFSRVMRCWGPR